MKKLLILTLTILFSFACENSVNLKGNDEPVIVDDNEEQDEEVQDETVDGNEVDEEVEDTVPDENETKDETVDTDVIWDNCSENYDCKVGELCAKKIGDCTGWGHCETVPETCDDVYDPVCGCDGVTYSNICEAHKLYRNAKHSGECE